MDAPAGHESPGDTRQFVGQSDCNQLWRFRQKHSCQPGTSRRAASPRPADDGRGSNDEQPPQIPLPHFRCPSQTLLASGRVLFWRKPDPRRKITALGKGRRRWCQGFHCCGANCTNPWNGGQARGNLVLSSSGPQVLLQRVDLIRQRFDVLQQSEAQASGGLWQVRMRFNCRRRGTFCIPCATTKPYSIRCPRNALIVAFAGGPKGREP